MAPFSPHNVLSRRALLAALTSAALFACVACGGGGEGLAATPTPPTLSLEPSPTPGVVIDDADVALTDAELERLREAIRSLGTDEPFHFTVEATLGAQVAGIALDIPVSAEGDYSPPDSTQATLTLDMGFVLTEFDTVAAGGNAYISDPQSGDWLQSPGQTGGLLGNPVELIRAIASVAGQLRPAGRGEIGGVEAVLLKADPAAHALGDQPATVEAWVATGDPRALRLSVKGPIRLSDLGRQFHSQIGDGPGDLAAEIGISAHGEPVSVEIPEVRTTLVDGKLPGEKQFEQINLTIDFGESHPDYNTVPATSGWHYGPPHAPARWGVHDQFIPDEVLLQNLVQGGIGLHYDCPEGCPEVVAAFSAIAERYPKIVVSPYEGMDSRIALTAWSYIDMMDEYDPERVDIFVRAHHNSERAPEYFKP